MVPTFLFSTTPNPSAITLGSSVPPVLKDTANFTSFVQGNITFTLFNPGGTQVDQETISVFGASPVTTPTGFSLPTSGTVAGTYQWNADFIGSGASESHHGDPTERVTVNAASPTLTTTPNPTVATLGSSAVLLQDTATLSGGYHETGTITFQLFDPLGSQVDIETVSVTGDNSYTTPSGFTIPSGSTLTGTYHAGCELFWGRQQQLNQRE